MSSGTALWAFDGNTLSDARLDVAPDGYAPRRAPDPGTEGDGAIGLRYDRWQGINRQIDPRNVSQTGVNWTHFQLRLQQDAEQYRYEPYTLSTPTGTFPGSSGHLSAVLMADGRVFCIPFNATSARIYDPQTDTLVTPGGTYPGNGAHLGGVLLEDGRIFCSPFSSTSARIYNPRTDTVVVAGGTYPSGSGQMINATLMADGRIFVCPYASTSARIYDPRTDRLTTPSPTFPGSDSVSSASLMPDGRIIMSPRANNATQARIYDPINDTLTTIATAVATTNLGLTGSTLMIDGRIYFTPYLQTTARIYDPRTDTVSTPGGTYPATIDPFGIGKVFLNGAIYITPRNQTSAYVYDPRTDSVTTFSGYPGSLGLYGAINLADGRLYLYPQLSTTARIVGRRTGYTGALRTHGPYLNNPKN